MSTSRTQSGGSGGAGSGGAALGRVTNEYYLREDCDRSVSTSTNTGTSFLTDRACPVAYLSGAGLCAFVTSSAAHQGILECSTSNSSSGAYSRLFALQRPSLVLGGGVMEYTAMVRVPVLSTALQRFDITIGFVNAISSITREVTAFYRDDVNGGNWRLRTQDSGGTTTTDTATVGPVAATWTKIKIIVDATAASVSLYVDDVLQATTSSNIPTDAMAPVASISKSIGTTARTLEVDYIEVYQVLTAAR